MKFTPQHDQMDCGPACLSMIASKYGKKYSLQYLRDNSFLTREGVSLLGLTEASKKIGFDTLSAKLTIEKLIDEKQTLPCILHWNQNHFVVLKKITRNIFTKKYYFHLADPAHGLIKLDEIKFKNSWIVDDNKGVSLFLEPTDWGIQTQQETTPCPVYRCSRLKPPRKRPNPSWKSGCSSKWARSACCVRCASRRRSTPSCCLSCRACCATT